MSLSQAFRNAILALLHDGGARSATEVVSWTEEQRGGGFCDTCSYTYVIVEILWRDAEGNTHAYEYSGTFTELLDRLLSAEEEIT